MYQPVPPQPTYGQPQPQPAAYGQPQPATYGQPQPAAYGQPHPAQPPYPQQGSAGQTPGHGYQVPGAAVRQCRFCGSVPAADATFRGHQGFLVIMRFLSLPGPYCRDCGLATFRRMTARTLVQGWYGVASLLITPVTVLINLLARQDVAKLPAPQPSPFGQSRQPMDPGAPLLTRPMALIGLAIPVALVLLLFLNVVLNA